MRKAKAAGSVGVPHAPGAQPTKRRAFANKANQGDSIDRQVGDSHENCLVRNTRSGCGMRMVARPSLEVTPVIPPADPLGL